jgi:regulator of cell morphogenesis and NO signaling
VKSIQELFQALTDELSLHMMKEENVLFPYLAQMEAALSEGCAVPPAMFGSVEMPISRMVADHDDAGALTARIRSLSGGFAAPADACPTYLALYQGLEDFERDLHQHIHLENNILFPRAVKMERKEGAHAGA